MAVALFLLAPCGIGLLLLLLAYLALANLATFLIFGADKAKASSGAWRISEWTLVLSCLAGGSLGGLAGMLLFRHKTRKWFVKGGVFVGLLANAVMVGVAVILIGIIIIL